MAITTAPKTDTVLDALNAQIKQLTDLLASSQTKLTNLQNDGNYSWYKSRVAILKSKNLFNVKDSNGYHFWADGQGQCWSGVDSERGWNAGMSYIAAVDSQVSQTQATIKNIKEVQLPEAQQALTDYLKSKQNDPDFIKTQTGLQTQLTQAQADAAKAVGKTAIWVWVTVGIVILGIATAVTIYLVRKNKKATA